MNRMSFAFLVVISLWTAKTKAQDFPAAWLNEKTWPAFVQDRELKGGGDDDQSTKLMKERCNAALDELRDRYIDWLQGEGALEQVCENAERFVSSRMEDDSPAPDHIRLLKQKLEFAKVVEAQAATLRKTNNSTRNVIDEKFARYYRLDVEIELMRMNKRAKNPDGKK